MISACGADEAPLGKASAAATGTLPAGTSIGVTIDSPAAGATLPPGPATVTGTFDLGTGTIVQDTDIVYVIDVSGSTSASAGGDCTGDGVGDTILRCEVVAVSALNAAAAANGNIFQVGLAAFAAAGGVSDLDPVETSTCSPRRRAATSTTCSAPW